MKTTSSEIERAINDILDIKVNTMKKKRGRNRKSKPEIWSLDFFNPSNNRTYALISMCIKEDFDQSIEQLALRLAADKCRKPTECLSVLRRLRKSGRLGYYDESRVFRMWHGEEAGYGLENLRS